jgi:uncharacterized protein YjiK
MITMMYKTVSLLACLLVIGMASCRNFDAKEVKIDSDLTLSGGETEWKKGFELSPLDSTKLSEVIRMYDLGNPDQVITLDKKLKEISGLSFDQKNNQILANNDEDGVIYYLDMEGRIVKEENFGKDGDYEGVERVGDNIVVGRSNGNLYFYDETSAETVKVKTDLKKDNDVEGLALDQQQNLLLLACKGAALSEKKSKREKFIYAYNLKLEVLHEEPFLVMPDAVHLSYVEYHIDDISQKEKEDLQKRVKSFAPSGIAINPINKDLYILSARGSFAVVYNTNHDFQDVLFFDEKFLPQPEGICFSPGGDLYVSTEGGKSDGKIVKYSRR